MDRTMKNEIENRRPLRSRLAAVFAAFLVCMTGLGELPAFAAEAVSDLLAADDEAEYIQPERIITDDETVETDTLSEETETEEDFPDVRAKYVPLGEAAADELILNTRSNAPVLLAAEAGETFTPDDYDSMVNNALKQFTLEYVFTKPEPYEGDTVHDITRTANFAVKGRLVINTDLSVQPGKMEIRIPGTLFKNRDIGTCSINSVAVTEFSGVPEKRADGSYDIEGKAQQSTVPFNYYVDTETGDYVFVNTGILDSSSNMMEISFDKVEVFDVKDETTWSVIPTVNVIYDIEKTGRVPNWHANSDNTNANIGGSNDIFTECLYTYEDDNGDTQKKTIYRRHMETTNSADKLYTYYDENGEPMFVEKLVQGGSEWYEIGAITEATVYIAEDLMKEHGTKITDPDKTPDIEVQMVERRIEDRQGEGLNGKINTFAELNKVTKKPAPDTGRGYGAQLYTIGQMSKYIDTSKLPPEVLNGSNLSSDYVYTCWTVTTNGDCTQPWSMLFEEAPKMERMVVKDGQLVPVLDEEGEKQYDSVDGALILGITTLHPNNEKHYDSKLSSESDEIQRLYGFVDESVIAADSEKKNTYYGDYWYVSDANSGMRQVFGQSKVVTDKTFSTNHYIVVAYPIDQLAPKVNETVDGTTTTHYPNLSNEITAHLYSRDSMQEVKAAESTNIDIEVKEYKWEGGKGSWSSSKSKPYTEYDKEGWLTIFDQLKNDTAGQPYLGTLTFYEGYHASFFDSCHSTTTEEGYKYKPGQYYKVVNVDDVMTAQPYGDLDTENGIKRVYGKPAVLDGSDYYYSNVELKVIERGIDPFEDTTYVLTSADAAVKISDDISRDWIVYGCFQDSSDPEAWQEIDLTKFGYPNEHLKIEDYVSLMNKSNGELTLKMNFSDKGLPAPFRVKVEHNAIEYESSASFTLTTRFLLDSPKLADNGVLRGDKTKELWYEDGTKVETDMPSLGSYRLNIKNYSANTAAAYNGTEKTKELLDIYNENTQKYDNYEINPYSSHVNANRYDFLAGQLRPNEDKLHTDPGWHIDADDRTKSALGNIVLKEENLPGYGDAEFLPLKYILGSEVSDTASRDDFHEINSHVLRDKVEIEVSQLEQNSDAEKFASWENDTRRGQVLMTYTLYGYEGFKVSKELKTLVESSNAAQEPLRNYIYMYDLLPANVNYYGDFTPIAGKLKSSVVTENDTITNDDVDSFVANSWDTSAVKIVETEAVPNWENTGRTLIRFKVEFNDPKGVLTDNNWYIGAGIRFKAYVSWDSYSTASEKDNIFAYVAADNMNNGNIYGRYSASGDSQVYDDAGIHIPHTNSAVESIDYTPFKDKTDFDFDSNNSEHNRMYGHANEMDSITTARTLGIKKTVKADAEKYADFDVKTSVVAANDYTYKIHIDHTVNGAASDIVIFDHLEAVLPGTWKGTFTGVDTTEIENAFPGKNITVYYAESRTAPTVLYKVDENYSLTGENSQRVEWSFEKANELADSDNKWIKREEWDETKPVGSIAVDFGNPDTNGIVLDEKTVFNLYIHMTAPGWNSNYTYTLNDSSFYFSDYIKNASGDYIKPEQVSFEYSNSNVTTVTIGQRRTVEVSKQYPTGTDQNNIPELLANAEFTFKVVDAEYSISDKVKAENGRVANDSIVQTENVFSNIGYKIYDVKNDGTRGSEIERGILHTTNDDGEFKLKYGQMAVFDEIAAYSVPTNKYDFDNFRIIEESAPYWLGVKSLQIENGVPTEGGTQDTADTTSKTEKLTFQNFYRPVIYITKNAKGVPDGVDVSTVFTYKIKISEIQYDENGEETGRKTLTAADFNDTATGYKILNKTITANNDQLDSREDGRLYWYSVNSSAGLYELPSGWDQVEDNAKFYKEFKDTDDKFGSKADSDGCYTVSFDASDNKIVAVPVYIQHSETAGGQDVGMLRQFGTGSDAVTKPRYSFEITEINVASDSQANAASDWVCSTISYGGVFGAEPNAFGWTNTYKYKNLLVTKKVTHAPDAEALGKYAFTFRLTENGQPYHQFKEAEPVVWTLCKMDSDGNLTEVKKDGTTEPITGEVDDNGYFVVPMCGNDSTKTDETYVIRLSRVAMGKSYTVTEVLDKAELAELQDSTKTTPVIMLPDYPTGVKLATTDDFSAVKSSDTKTIKENTLQTAMSIENDYLKRDITVKKTVAAATMPEAGHKFTMVLCPNGLTAAPDKTPSFTVTDKNGTDRTSVVTVRNVSEPDYGYSFDIEEGWSITFEDIGNAGEQFSLYERLDADYLPLTLTYDENWQKDDYSHPEVFKLSASEDYKTDVVNGTEGYIVLRKQYTGTFADIAEELNNSDEYKVKLKLELKAGNEYKPVDGLPISNNDTAPLKIASGSTITPLATTENIEINGSDVVIVNLAELTKRRTGSASPLCDYRVTETVYTKSIYKDGNWYTIEPENSGGIWEHDKNDKQAVVVNNVTKYSDGDVIYKRIGCKTSTKRPKGTISFTLRDSSGAAVSGIRCTVGYIGDNSTDVLTGYTVVSDADGVINIDFNDSEVRNNGWSAADGATMYYLKLHFDRAVKINPTGDVISITENTAATDKSWGVPCGYELFGVETSYVDEELLKERNQWEMQDADTFVNTQETEKIEVTKTVNASGDVLSDDDKNAVFRFTVSELIGTAYQPAPHISYTVYELTDRDKPFDAATNPYKETPVRTGVTDLESGDSATGWGVFTLQHGQKAVLDLPKDAYWQITEDNTGKYKLVVDADGNIVHDSIEGDNDNVLGDNEATARNAAAAGENYNASEIAQGFEMNSTLDMENGEPTGYPVVLINGSAGKNQAMFAKYDESQDSVENRTVIFKGEQNNDMQSNYYAALNGSGSWGPPIYDNKDFTIGYNASSNDRKIQVIYADSECTDVVWSSTVIDGTSGVAQKYQAKKNQPLLIPEKIYFADPADDNNIVAHYVVGIGRSAYYGKEMSCVTIPQYVEKIGDWAFARDQYLNEIIWNGDSTQYGVKVLGLCSIRGTHADVILPNTVVTVETGAYNGYVLNNGSAADDGTYHIRNEGATTFVLPSTLRYVSNDKALGYGANQFANNYMTLRIGSESYIPEMTTSFKRIGNNSNSIEFDTLALNKFHNKEMYWYTIIIGSYIDENNEDGLTILQNFNGVVNNDDRAKTVVFPKGKLTLQQNCLNNSRSGALRIFLTDNINDLTLGGNLGGNANQNIVFLNLTKDEVPSSITSKISGKIYYKDTLTSSDVNTIVNGVGSRSYTETVDGTTVPKTESRMDSQVLALLTATAANNNPKPQSKPPQAALLPTIPTDNIRKEDGDEK